MFFRLSALVFALNLSFSPVFAQENLSQLTNNEQIASNGKTSVNEAPLFFRDQFSEDFKNNINAVFAPSDWMPLLSDLTFKNNDNDWVNDGYAPLGDVKDIKMKVRWGNKIYIILLTVEKKKARYVLLTISDDYFKNKIANYSVKGSSEISERIAKVGRYSQIREGVVYLNKDATHLNEYIIRGVNNLTFEGASKAQFIPDELVRRLEKYKEIDNNLLMFLSYYLPNVNSSRKNVPTPLYSQNYVPEVNYIQKIGGNWTKNDLDIFTNQFALRIKNRDKLDSNQKLVLASYNKSFIDLMNIEIPEGDFSSIIEPIFAGNYDYDTIRLKSQYNFSYIVLIPKAKRGVINKGEYLILPDWKNVYEDILLSLRAKSANGNHQDAKNFTKAVMAFAVKRPSSDKQEINISKMPLLKLVANSLKNDALNSEFFPNTFENITKSSDEDLAKIEKITPKSINLGFLVSSTIERNSSFSKNSYFINTASSFGVSGTDAYLMWDVTNNKIFGDLKEVSLSDFNEDPKIVSKEYALNIISGNASSQLTNAVYNFSTGFNLAKNSKSFEVDNFELKKNKFIQDYWNGKNVEVNLENQIIRKNYKGSSYSDVVFFSNDNYYEIKLDDTTVINGGKVSISSNNFFNAKKVINYKKRVY